MQRHESFGGEGKLKQSCKMRKCLVLDSTAGTSKEISLTSVSISSIVSSSSLHTLKPPPPGFKHDYNKLDLEQSMKRKRALANSSSSLELQQLPRKNIGHILSPIPSSPVSMVSTRNSSSALSPHMTPSQKDVSSKPWKRRRILISSSSSLLQSSPQVSKSTATP